MYGYSEHTEKPASQEVFPDTRFSNQDGRQKGDVRAQRHIFEQRSDHRFRIWILGDECRSDISQVRATHERQVLAEDITEGLGDATALGGLTVSNGREYDGCQTAIGG